VTLYLANGGVVTGELVRETPNEVVLRFDYGEIGFQRAEIQRMATGQQETTGADGFTMPWEGEHAKVKWPYKHDIVVKLTKGTAVEGDITAVGPETVTVTQRLAGGGAVEHTIKRAEVEQVLFRPIANARSEAILATLQQVLPKMHVYPEGFFTIVTDSAPPMVKDYRRTIRELSTDWYFTFYPLLKDRTPTVQQVVVIFDDWGSYIEYAATDGVPGWLAVGYYHPEDQVLYAFNMVGDRFSELLYDAYLGQFRKARDQVLTQMKGSGEELSAEGQLREFLSKLEEAHGRVRQIFQQFSVDTLRHELTHGLFHNWEVQGIILSEMTDAPAEEIQKKRQFLEATSQDEKRQLLDELLSQQTRTSLQETRAANSWFIEGLAGYMEPSPAGAVNKERLFEVQEAKQRGRLMPLEFLHAFKMGSFLSMAPQSGMYAYAQSWAMCHFLLDRHRDAFLAFLDRVAREEPAADVDTLPWLVSAVGMEQRALEQEFQAYLDEFPPEDPLWLKQMQLFLDLRAELMALANRLWSR
jgi:hypothetical protein